MVKQMAVTLSGFITPVAVTNALAKATFCFVES